MTNPFKKTYKMNKAGNLCDAYGKPINNTPPKTPKENKLDTMAAINSGRNAFMGSSLYYKKKSKKK